MHQPDSATAAVSAATIATIPTATPTAAAPLDPSPSRVESGYVTFGRAITLGFQQYAGFTGVAPRSEYWFWQLFVFLINLGGSILASITSATSDTLGALVYLMLALALLGLLLPTIAVTVRRIRDTGLSPWLIFLGFVPFLGGIAIFVFTLLRTNSVKS